MTQEELKIELIKAAENGQKNKFYEISSQLEQSIENRLMINLYNGILNNHSNVRSQIAKNM